MVNIPPEVKHWHGADADSWFSHLAVEVPAEGASAIWVGNMYFEEGVNAVTSASVNIEGDDISGNAQLLAKMA